MARAFDTSNNESGDSREVCYSPNRPPVLDTVGAKAVEEGQSLEFSVSANDPDGDSLSYAAANLPSGASFDATAQRFSWTPGFGAADNYNVTFTVTDDGSPPQSDSEEVLIDVFGDDEPPGAPADLEIVGM